MGSRPEGPACGASLAVGVPGRRRARSGRPAPTSGPPGAAAARVAVAPGGCRAPGPDQVGGGPAPVPGHPRRVRWRGSEDEPVEIRWQVAGEWGAWRRLSIWHDAGDHDAGLVATGLVRPASGATRLGVRWSAGATGLEAVVIDAGLRTGPVRRDRQWPDGCQPSRRRSRRSSPGPGGGPTRAMRKGPPEFAPDLEADRAPHGDAQRRPRPGPDRAGGLRLPHPPQRLERHRVQLPRRPAGPGLRRPLRPALPARARRPPARTRAAGASSAPTPRR